jgi:hypothetical protein
LYDESQKAEDVESNIACVTQLQEILLETSVASGEFLNFIYESHDSVASNFWEEKYTPFYSDLGVLYEKYKEAYTLYNDVLREFVELVSNLRNSKGSYDRLIAQMDYLGDAYEELIQISIPMKALTIPKQPETRLQDIPSVVSNLAALCDLMEKKMFRGYVTSNNFSLLNDTFDENQKTEQEAYLKTVESYNRDDMNMATIGAFTDAYAKLDPAYVVRVERSELFTIEDAKGLFEKAKVYCQRGLFLQATNVCELALVLPVRVYDGDTVLYPSICEFLKKLLVLTGHSTSVVDRLPETPTKEGRLRVLFLFQGSSNDAKIPTLVRQELNGFQSPLRKYTKLIASMFKYVNHTNLAQYRKCLVNYICFKFFLGEMNTREALRHPKISEATDFQKILKFFPENHVGRTIVSNVNDALLNDKMDDTLLYIGKFLREYIFKRRRALDDLRVPTDTKLLKRSILPTLAGIKDSLVRLKYVKDVLYSAKNERENKWPKKGVGSLFFRNTNVPYVDGNYTINVAVELVLSMNDPDKFDALSCMEKTQLAKDVASSLF